MPFVKLKEMWPIIQEALERNQSITIPVTGSSMQPTLEHGDAVTLIPVDLNKIKRGDILLYRRQHGQFVMHRVVRVHKTTIDFCGDAQVTIERDVPKSAVLACVSSYEKNGRKFDKKIIRKDARRRLNSRLFRMAATKFHRLRKSSTTITPHRYIGSYLKKSILSIILMGVLSCISAAGMLGMTMASGRIINKAIYEDMQNFKEWFFLLMFLLVAVCLCRFAYSALRVRTIGRMKMEIREDMFALLLSKRYSHVQRIHSGDILNRLTDDLQIVADTAVTLIPQFFSMITKLVGGIGFLFFIDPIFASILLGCGLVCGSIFQIFSRIYKRLHRECQETEGRSRSYMQECIENLIVVKSFVNEAGVLAKLREFLNINYRKQVHRNIYAGIGNSLIYFGFTFAYYIAMAWGILQVAGVFTDGRPAMLVGTFVVILQIIEQIRSPFRSATGLLPQYYSMIASAERLQEFSKLPAEERSVLTKSLDCIYDDLQSIQLDRVSFSYASTPVFRDYDLELNKGDLTAIVGASGSGKTTLIKLLLGLVYPQKGSVVLHTTSEDVDVDASTRGLFAYVPQGNMILSGTIAENISFGNREFDDDAIKSAIKSACLDELIDSLENGIHTRVGERGIGLSEGQIQRVAIARALLSGAPILLLDECTSALDLQTEIQLIENLKAMNDRTIIFISHREAVLKRADRIVKIDKLHIKEAENI